MSESLFFTATAEDFKKIPGSPVAYWVSDNVRNIFAENPPLGNVAEARQGLATADNNRFLRFWPEVNIASIGFSMSSCSDALRSAKKWFPYNKGGEFRKWYGNQEYVVNWEKDGQEIRNFFDENGRLRSRPQNTVFYFRESVSWSDVTSAVNAFRFYPKGFIHDIKGQSLFGFNSQEKKHILSFLNLKFIYRLTKILNPSLSFQVGNLNQLPHLDFCQDSSECIMLEKSDWDAYETSWNFQSLPLLRPEYRSNSLPAAYADVRAVWQAMTEEMQRLEEENNRVFIEAYGLQDELTPDVPLKEITLTCNPFYRYGVDAEQADAATRTALEDRLRADSVKELLSYAIGCMMGRYSLDAAGLVYAAAGNAGFDAGKYTTFPADEDGIVPLGDMPWFDDDAAHRFREFCLAVWGEESLEENLRFVADQLDPKRGETPEATIRRWLSGKFFKDWHCKVYKKRPIYWLFSSGKHKAFECLVYLHRFNSNTLPRMRAAYVTPLQGKIAARLELLEREEAGAGSTSSRNALKKQRELLLKKQDELRHFDDLLRHYADQNIQLDLDDGVKVNYAKLADLLAESKTITGGKEE
nr:BREX-1 system adenine-specific DNA-methyltransferase PglX [Desulfovibrio piger]